MGKLDIDYQVLHDAFFKYQTKPHLSGLGELYYEGKEFEARVRLPFLPDPFINCITCAPGHLHALSSPREPLSQPTQNPATASEQHS